MKPEPEKLQVCPICHELDTTDEIPGAVGPARRFPLVRCLRCGLVFQRYRPADEQLEAGQRNAYGAPHRRFHSAMERTVGLARASRVRLATRLIPSGGRVLDVGCGRGLFLRSLKSRGYEVQGTELSALTAANTYPGIPVDLGDLRVGQYPDNHFDLVSVWHVLEHLRHPDEVLRACCGALRPGGSLLVAVPNYGSVQSRLGGEHWFHLDLPRHTFQFTEATLRRMLCDAGFEIDTLRTGQWEMDPFGLLQTVLNRMGLRHNALYDVLRNCEEDKSDLSRLYRSAMLALLPFGMVAATGVSAILRLLGRAGTLIVIAHKVADRV
jgi:2-polyprenyl-3-methyl-5-hydroxy-6-metoxy-1,4-benzoquinol methylase